MTLDFGHEGVLFKRSFVMYDKQTNSKWNHSTGLAMKGPLAGRRLNQLPARMVHWEEWRQQHPNTRVLPGASAWGFTGSYRGRSRPDALGISVGMGPRPTLYPYDHLMEQPVLNDEAGHRKIVVVMDVDSKQTAVYSRVVGDRELHFEAVSSESSPRARMRDRETGTIWDRLEGRAIRGPLKGTRLSSRVGVTWLKGRWRDIYPDGVMYGN